MSNSILERYIRKYPHEYFWFYKIWKYSNLKPVVILSDGKTGHIRQSQAALKLINEAASSYPEGKRCVAKGKL